jgi:outer membrane receptor protein involved in Fe transport
MRRVSVIVVHPMRTDCSARREQLLASACVFAVLASPVSVRADPAADQVVELPVVEVTETRIPENVDQVPAHLTIIPGDELRTRGVTDLRTALSLTTGVEAPPGGDTGPAGAVPSFWGLHEFDAFLLVVDGVPWGGAFNPSIQTLNLNNVERIEILRGAAPVMYGATSFVGVIQVIHYPAG